ncbi:putative MFS family arabinose efflux permease [Homoserinimonas aerilata]|uniref:Putative MFS family arabinose efflux permease n=2 Tax=Homoserinimonas aerilata TaxID=1162970 RepID=A0A542YAB8_9MICO|nr:putative MFS family arabinose efflux permease [Homoserinimonas aerilata]
MVLVHAAIVQVLTFAVRPNLSYAVLDGGGSAALLGIIAAAFAIPALLMALPAGHAVDRIGERPALVLGSAAIVVACIIAALAGDSFVMLVIATIILGCGHLMSVVGDQAMMANAPGDRGLDSRFGLYAFAASIGQVVGPLLLTLPGGTRETPPVQLIFIVCTGIAVVLLVLSSLMGSTRRHAPGVRVGMRSTAVGLLRMPGIPQAMIASAIVLASVDLFLAYVPALGHERGFTAEIVSLMLVVRSLMSMFSRLFLSQLIALVGRRALLVSTVLISAVMLGCMILPLPVVLFLVLSAVYGFAVGTCQPITMAWISELAPPGSRGLAMSLRVASNRVGQTALPAVFGTFAVATGSGGVLAVTGVALLGAAWAAASLVNRSTGGEAEPSLPEG